MAVRRLGAPTPPALSLAIRGTPREPDKPRRAIMKLTSLQSVIIIVTVLIVTVPSWCLLLDRLAGVADQHVSVRLPHRRVQGAGATTPRS